MHKDHSKHQFALFFARASELASLHSKDDVITIDDSQLFHRICNVLRLSPNELYIIFDKKQHIVFQLVSTSKKNIVTSKIISIEPNQISKPHITFLLPLLKRDAFKETLYSLTEIGASEIIPIITGKTHRSENINRSPERLERIIHAAAEQSKNFSFPVLHKSTLLKDTLSELHSGPRLFFDPDGKNILPVVTEINNTKASHITLMVGPEADLLPEEKQQLHENGFTFCKLTQTVLRAQQAAVVSLGIFRSILKQ